MRTTSILACAIVAAVLISDAAHARPSPEAALSGGYRGGRQYFYYPLVSSAPVGQPIFLYPAEPPQGGAQPPGEDLESTEIRPPPPGASVAEAQPVGIAIAGPGGVAAAQPIGQAVVGPGGLAIARPIGTAVAGVPGVTGVPGASGGPPAIEAEEPPKITIYYTPGLHPYYVLGSRH